MNWKLIIGVIVVFLIVLGFAIGALFPSKGIACTELGCPCNEGAFGERPCNQCSSSNLIFALGIINVRQQCSYQEIVICENGAQIDSRMDNKQCEINFDILE